MSWTREEQEAIDAFKYTLSIDTWREKHERSIRRTSWELAFWTVITAAVLWFGFAYGLV